MESVSRMHGVLETTHGLTLDAARDAAFLRKTSNNPPIRNAQLKKLLDSRNEREVLEGLRSVIAVREDFNATSVHTNSWCSSRNDLQRPKNRSSSRPS